LNYRQKLANDEYSNSLISYNLAVQKRFPWLFSDQGELKEPVRLGLWVLALFVAAIVALTYFSRPSGKSGGAMSGSSTSEDATHFVLTAGSFTRGTRLFNVLRGASIPPRESQNVVQTLSKFLDPRTLNEADRYEVLHSTSGKFRSLSVVRKLERFIVESAPVPAPLSAERRGLAAPHRGDFPAALSARKEPIPLTRTEKTAAGTLAGSLWLSLRGQGMDAGVIVELADIFAWDIDFLTETRDGDRWALTWEEERTPEGRLVNVKILGAIYTGKNTGHHTATRFMDEYFDAEGASLRRAFLHAPLNFRRISSGFTNRRFHPILRTWRPHHGTDYAAATGTPAVTVGDGTVFFRGYKGGLGNVVKVRHNGTYSSYYGHLSRFAKGVTAGTRVKQGQVIGYVGSTGLSTGPHLHFEMIKNGTSVNFLSLKVPSVGSVPPARKQAFQEKRDRILPPLEEQLPPTPRK
jgi:murein DD-endopeptidase MepM/ murein hydrolase activator NlpD